MPRTSAGEVSSRIKSTGDAQRRLFQRLIRAEDGVPDASAGRGAHTEGESPGAVLEGGLLRLDQVLDGDPPHCVLSRDGPPGLCGEPHCELDGPQPRGPGPAHLEDPQARRLDRELHLARVGEMLLQLIEGRQQLLLGVGEAFGEGAQVQGRVGAGDHVLPLGPPQEFAPGRPFAGREITGEGHAASRMLVPVAEHHRLHVDRGAFVVVESGVLAVGDGPGRIPRGEDGAHGRRQLLPWIVGECRGIVGEKGAAHGAGGRDIPGCDRIVAALENDLAVHEEEAPVTVPGEVLVAGADRERVTDLRR